MIIQIIEKIKDHSKNIYVEYFKEILNFQIKFKLLLENSQRNSGMYW